MRPHTLTLLFALATLAACAAGPRWEDHNRQPLRFGQLVDDCATQDVVFFGEAHPNDACHEEQRRLLAALVERRKDVVVTMEMFERDVQPKLDAYLHGKLPEAQFRKEARAWKNWHHYRPLVQIAAAHGLPVLAANAPIELVRKVSRGGGLDAVAGAAHVAKVVEAPQDAHFEAFIEAMTGEPMDADKKPASWMLRFYEAQVLRDETMAETISEHLEAAHRQGRRPLVLHFCGNFHSAGRRGTVSRLLRRMPALKIRVIETEVVGGGDEDGELSPLVAGDVRLFSTDTATTKKMPSKHPAMPAHPKASHPAKPVHPVAKPEDHEHAGEEQRRPGLGFMPDYEGEGVGVALVAEGSAAAKAGIKAGDNITSLDGEAVETVREYSEVLGGLKIGSTVKVELLRDGKKVSLDVVVGESRR